MKRKILSLILIILLCFCGCNNEQKQKSNVKLDAISTIKENINKDIQDIKNKTYQNISFSQNVVVIIPDCDNVCELKMQLVNSADTNTQVAFVKQALEKWYPQGLNDTFINDNLRINDELGRNLGDPSKPSPYNYAKLSDFPNEKNIVSLYLKTKDFSITTDGLSILDMSKGGISHILDGPNSLADRFDRFEEIETIYKENSKDFVLHNKNYSFADVERYVNNLFVNELSSIKNPGISIHVPEITKFKLDENSYALRVICARTFNNVPFEYVISGTSYSAMSDGNNYISDMYSVDIMKPDDFDSIYGGSCSVKVTTSGEKSDKIIPVAELFDLMSEIFSSQINLEVNKIELVYTQRLINDTETIGRPTWKVHGKNKINNQNIEAYVDALTGECRYRRVGAI